MAIIDLNTSKDILVDAATREKALASGLRQLQDAFKAERYHPVVLNLVANHCHNMGLPEKVTLSKQSRMDGDIDSIWEHRAWSTPRKHWSTQTTNSSNQKHCSKSPEHIMYW